MHAYAYVYLRRYYQASNTKLKLDQQLSETILCTRGIKQGVPLSVHLFNAVINLATESLDPKIGFKLAPSTTVSYMAYADDLMLFTSSDAGLRRNFSIVKEQLALSGLKIRGGITRSGLLS